MPEVNAGRALEHEGIVANPNCCTIPLTSVLKPLHDEAGLVRIRVATYQSVSGAGAQAMERLRNEPQEEHDLRMDWDFDGEEFDEESKLRVETQKIMELPDLPIQATCVRVPVMVGHAEAIWVEIEQPLPPTGAGVLAGAPSVRVEEFPPPGKAPVMTRCSSGASAVTRRSSAASRSSWRVTISARAQHSTRSRSRSSCSGAHAPLRRARRFVQIGMVGRFFPLNWRPPVEEILFAAEHGFAAIQIRSDRAGAIAEYLRADPPEVGAAFESAGVEPVLEMLVRHEGALGTFERALEANLTAIAALGAQRVHIHPVGGPRSSRCSSTSWEPRSHSRAGRG